MAIECLVLGAGQEVGKSCVVVSIGGKRIMFDCGMHMGYLDHRRYPDFSRISESGDFDSAITCIIITHFHLDHIGALPYFTEVCGYRGPIYMTYPTRALAPLMLEDYRKVMVDRRGEKELFSSDGIIECMKKVIAVDLKQTIYVDRDLQIRAYYAGHVIGAAMFYAKVGDSTMVYTGDYNMTPDRHLGAAQIDRLQLDLLITESTYATTIRDSKYAREREFLKAVHKCVSGGGKVLIPTFALGRAQELCILLDDYWERMNLKVPIYFSAGLTIQANMYYKMLIGWTSQRIKDSYSIHNTFDFKHVCPFDRSLITAPGPCVLFATPGMISGGFSLEVFKQWAPSEMNLVTLPGYCVAGTIGHKLMSSKPTRIDLDKDTHIDVRCQIHQLSFSPHTDGKGIMDLIRFLMPQHVVLVHGEKPKMATLKGAGQEVGKSCVVVLIGGKRIMFDCRMHMGYLDHLRYPDFSRISESGDFDSAITCIIITHFHLDHIGALPYFTEVCGYCGPIYMTYPTRALAPLMLEDYRKVMVDRRGEKELFSSDGIIECMKKVIAVDLKQIIYVDRDLQIRAYYAGHVIGAAMFYAKVGDSTMVYTGDYNMTPDRHLGAAQIDRLQLDLLITESTYATTIRDSKYAREREFLKAVCELQHLLLYCKCS